MGLGRLAGHREHDRWPEVRKLPFGDIDRDVHVAVDAVAERGPVDPRPASTPRRIVNRLGREAIRNLVLDSRSGVTHKELAARYAISVSSVKRLLRQATSSH